MNVAEIRRYLTFGYLAIAAVTILMFVRAAVDGFSSAVALCLTRGGESCFDTSNPVWTAETLRWLTPIVFILTVIGFFGLALIEDAFFGIGSAVIVILTIVSLGLNSEIKDKDAFLNPNQPISNTVLIPNPSNNGISSFEQNQLESQLDSVRQSACSAADNLQFQWVQLNIKLQDLRSISQNSFETDALVQQLQLQVMQLQQQESSLRQQCNG